ncbi:hypothetical protein EMIT0324P_30819 [Pseudomonas chlororaphis]
MEQGQDWELTLGGPLLAGERRVLLRFPQAGAELATSV